MIIRGFTHLLRREKRKGVGRRKTAKCADEKTGWQSQRHFLRSIEQFPVSGPAGA